MGKLMQELEAWDLMRILLAGMPNMLTGIITAALQQSPDVAIAAVVNERKSLSRQIRASRAEAVIMQIAEPGNFEHVRSLLLSFPTLKIIGIRSDGESAFLHELHSRSTQLVELSAATLLAALQPGPEQATH
jgi:hypothetical protein